MVSSGESVTLTPAASARSHSPARSDWIARCTATSDDEQAVSTTAPGPCGAEAVGEPAGSGAGCVAEAGIGVDPLGAASGAQQRAVVVGAEADEHADLAAEQGIGRDPGVLERMPARLQQQAVLGVERFGLAARDREMRGIEPVDIGEEAAPAGGHLARPVGIGVVPGVDVPAVAGHLGDGVAAAAEQAPVGGGIVGPAGKAAGRCRRPRSGAGPHPRAPPPWPAGRGSWPAPAAPPRTPAASRFRSVAGTREFPFELIDHGGSVERIGLAGTGTLAAGGAAAAGSSGSSRWAVSSSIDG